MFSTNKTNTSLINEYSIKSLRQIESRRGVDWSCNLFKNNKKIAEISYSSETQDLSFSFLNILNDFKATQELLSHLHSVNFSEALFLSRSFLDEPYYETKNIDDEEILSGFAELLIFHFELKKKERKLAKNCLSHFCRGTLDQYVMKGFRITFDEVIEQLGVESGMARIQASYDRAKSDKECIGKFLNSKKQMDAFVAMGLVL